SHSVSAIILAPTRELALQIESVAEKIARPLGYRVLTVYGGVSLSPQIESLRHGIDIVVGTPGRVLDLIERGELNLHKVKSMVLDEADIMLDMGFIDDCERIIEQTPEEKQMMMFSATVPIKIKSIASMYMHNVTYIDMNTDETSIVENIEHNYAVSSSSYKFSTILAYITKYKPKKAIVFTNTQRSASLLNHILRSQSINTAVLHGGMTQQKRRIAIDRFRESSEGMLIATNVAARGIDITDVGDIINFDAPEDPILYIHRVGRTARMQKSGRAFTIFGYDQRDLIYDIEEFCKIKFRKVDLDIEKFKGIDFGREISKFRNSYEYKSLGNRSFSRDRNDRGYGSSRGNDNRPHGNFHRGPSRRPRARRNGPGSQ
ncbi:MAG: DEAD/DEAH box helicase, partial [Candidatus Micrarchaeaceae archaeon]